MNIWLLLFVAAIYVYVGVGYAVADNWGKCVAWTAYALANLGFVLDDMGW